MSKKDRLVLHNPAWGKKTISRLKWYHKLLFLTPIILIAFVYKSFEWRETYLLDKYGVGTIATINRSGISGVRNTWDVENIAYYFSADNKIFYGYAVSPVADIFPVTPFDVPISTGDEFYLVYYPDDPGINKIDFSRPTSATVNKYLYYCASVFADEVQKNNLLKKPDGMCLALKVVQVYGFDAIANTYLRKLYAVDNFAHNGTTYKKMISSEAFKQAVKACTGE